MSVAVIESLFPLDFIGRHDAVWKKNYRQGKKLAEQTCTRGSSYPLVLGDYCTASVAVMADRVVQKESSKIINYQSTREVISSSLHELTNLVEKSFVMCRSSPNSAGQYKLAVIEVIGQRIHRNTQKYILFLSLFDARAFPDVPTKGSYVRRLSVGQ